jgi:hypothetical protein
MLRTQYDTSGISGRDLIAIAEQSWRNQRGEYIDGDAWSQFTPDYSNGESPFGNIGFLAEGMDPTKSFKMTLQKHKTTPKNQSKAQPSLEKFFNKVRFEKSVDEQQKTVTERIKLNHFLKATNPTTKTTGETTTSGIQSVAQSSHGSCSRNSIELSTCTPPKAVGFYSKKDSCLDMSKRSLDLEALDASVKTNTEASVKTGTAEHTSGNKSKISKSLESSKASLGFSIFSSSNKSSSTDGKSRMTKISENSKQSLGLSALGASRTSHSNASNCGGSGSEDFNRANKGNFNFSVGEKFSTMWTDMKRRDHQHNSLKTPAELARLQEKELLVQTLEREHLAARQENELLKAKLAESLVYFHRVSALYKWKTIEELATVTTQMTQAKQRYQEVDQERIQLQKALKEYEAMVEDKENYIAELEEGALCREERISLLEARLRQNGIVISSLPPPAKGGMTKPTVNIDDSFSVAEMADDIISCFDGPNDAKGNTDASTKSNESDGKLGSALAKLENSDDRLMRNLFGIEEDLSLTLSEFTKLSSTTGNENSPTSKGSPTSKASTTITPAMVPTACKTGLHLEQYMDTMKLPKNNHTSFMTSGDETWAANTVTENALGKGMSTASPVHTMKEGRTFLPGPATSPISAVGTRSMSTTPGRPQRSKSDCGRTTRSRSPTSGRQSRSKSPAAGRPPALRKQLRSVVEVSNGESHEITTPSVMTPQPATSEMPPSRRKPKGQAINPSHFLGRGSNHSQTTDKLGRGSNHAQTTDKLGRGSNHSQTTDKLGRGSNHAQTTDKLGRGSSHSQTSAKERSPVRQKINRSTSMHTTEQALRNSGNTDRSIGRSNSMGAGRSARLSHQRKVSVSKALERVCSADLPLPPPPPPSSTKPSPNASSRKKSSPSPTEMNRKAPSRSKSDGDFDDDFFFPPPPPPSFYKPGPNDSNIRKISDPSPTETNRKAPSRSKADGAHDDFFSKLIPEEQVSNAVNHDKERNKDDNEVTNNQGLAKRKITFIPKKLIEAR